MSKKYCPNCGIPLEEGAQQCRLCKTPIVTGEVIPPNRSYVQQDDVYDQQTQYNQDGGYGQQTQYNQNSGYSQKIDYQSNGAGNKQPAKEVITNADRIFAVMAYVGFFVIVPILFRPNSRFVRFHVNQGLVLFLIDSIMMLIGGVVGGVWIMVKVLDVIQWLCYVMMILGILFALQGREKELPLIGKIKLLR